MRNHIISSVLSLTLVLTPQVAFSAATKPDDKKPAPSKLRRKFKTGKIIKSSSRSLSQKKKQRPLARAPQESLASRPPAACEHPLLMRVIPQRDGRFIVESLTSKKRKARSSRPASKLDRGEVIPACVLGRNNFEPKNFRELIIARAKAYYGTPYARGASLASNSATDCSGFVQYVFAGFKMDLPRTSVKQAQVGKVVTYRMDFSKMLPGDLLFFRRGSQFIGHAGIYLGEGKMIHSSNHRHGVTISNLRQALLSRHLCGGQAGV